MLATQYIHRINSISIWDVALRKWSFGTLNNNSFIGKSTVNAKSVQSIHVWVCVCVTDSFRIHMNACYLLCLIKQEFKNDPFQMVENVRKYLSHIKSLYTSKHVLCLRMCTPIMCLYLTDCFMNSYERLVFVSRYAFKMVH